MLENFVIAGKVFKKESLMFISLSHRMSLKLDHNQSRD